MDNKRVSGQNKRKVATMMDELEQLKSEYLRSKIYGPGKNRRQFKFILPELRKMLGEKADEAVGELDKVIASILEIGKKAESLAAQGKQRDSLEYDALDQEARKLGTISQQYFTTKFQNALLSGKGQPNEQAASLNALASLQSAIEANSGKIRSTMSLKRQNKSGKSGPKQTGTVKLQFASE